VRFNRALRVALQDDAQNFFAIDRFEQAFERGALRNIELAGALRVQPLFTQGFCVTLRFHNKKFIARIWKSGKTENLYGRRRSGLLHRFTPVVDERFHFAAVIATNEDVTDLERPHLHDNRRGRPAARFDLRFNDRAAWRGRGRCFQFHHFGLQRHHFDQLIDAGSFGCGNRNNNCFAAPIFGLQTFLL
jgi:hypothetical protein